MNYPLISEYIEAIKSAEDNFDELCYLRPVLNKDGMPVMSVGGFSVVFKMKDERDGKYYAVKCFTKEQKGRAEGYKLIADELEFVSSNYLIQVRYLEKELFVDTEQTDEDVFPVLMMDWVEGKTLDKYLRENSENKFLLELLAYQFCKMASWLLSQPFAHGDLKPDNILIKNNGSIVLVDYDGMYVPTMKGENAREQGSPGFRHLTRLNGFFDEHIDDFPIALIAMALKAYSINPELLNEYCNNDTMFFTEKDFAHIHSTKAMMDIIELIDNEELCSLCGAFMVVLAKGNLSLVSPKLYTIKNPKTEANYGSYIYNQARSLCEEAKDKSKIDHNKAFKLFQKAAKLGNSDAQCCMGCCLKNGYGTQVDYSKAREWYDVASRNGCARALRHIGFCFQDGDGVEKDINMAIEWYDKAIDLGDVSAMVTKGAIYYYGKGGIPINYEEAVKWFKKAAESGDDDGMWRLGVCFSMGRGVDKDYNKAYEWFSNSAKKNNANGIFGLGKIYYFGLGVNKNYLEAATLFKTAANLNQKGAMWRLGHCYEYGHGVEKNLKMAHDWYKKSAELGSSEGQWRLGQCYRYSRGAPRNIKEALKWYKKAADQGHEKAKEVYDQLNNNSFEIYTDGCTHIKNKEYKEAYEVFRSMSLDAYGQNGLGVCYAYGYFVEKDMEKAAYWFLKAARGGLGVAQFNIANCYYNGNGVNEDRKLAFHWYKKADEQGLDIAKEMLTYEGVGGKSEWGRYEDKLNVERWNKIASIFILRP